MRGKDRPGCAATPDTDKRQNEPGYGWVVLAVGFLITTLTYGGSYSFGLFFKPLRAQFGWSSAQTSGIFSLFMFCYCFFGILSGQAVDRLGPRVTSVVGGLFLGTGFVLSGMVHELWQIYLSYGLIAGAGMSCVYSPVLTTASRWFPRRQGLALGIVSSGIGIGTFVGPPAFGHLISLYGWRFAYLTGGLGIGGTMVLLGLLLGRRPSHITSVAEQERQTVGQKENKFRVDDWGIRQVVSTRPFWIFSTLYVMVGFGLQMMLAHLVPYMQETYRLSAGAAAAVFSVIGVASAVGRLFMGGISDYLGTRRSLALSVAIESVAVVLILLSADRWMLYLSGILFGFGYGGHAPQFPAVMREIFGMKQMGRNLGLPQVFYGLGALIGPFFAGLLYDRAGTYVAPFATASLVLMLAACLSLTLKRPAHWE